VGRSFDVAEVMEGAESPVTLTGLSTGAGTPEPVVGGVAGVVFFSDALKPFAAGAGVPEALGLLLTLLVAAPKAKPDAAGVLCCRHHLVQERVFLPVLIVQETDSSMEWTRLIEARKFKMLQVL
jgi:hypothetical protein